MTEHRGPVFYHSYPGVEHGTTLVVINPSDYNWVKDRVERLGYFNPGDKPVFGQTFKSLYTNTDTVLFEWCRQNTCLDYRYRCKSRVPVPYTLTGCNRSCLYFKSATARANAKALSANGVGVDPNVAVPPPPPPPATAAAASFDRAISPPTTTARSVSPTFAPLKAPVTVSPPVTESFSEVVARVVSQSTPAPVVMQTN